MTLDVIATGSSGNSYLLHDKNECLILETGIPLMEVKKALDFNIRPIVGGVSSHEHGDHFKHHAEYERVGIKMFYPFLTDNRSVQFGNFKIKAFENPHGESTSYGFYIQHNELGKLLFVTDAEYVKYDFSALNINHIMVEANYQKEYLDTEKANFEHKVRGHMSLDTCKQFVRHNNSPHLRTVCLIHSNPMTLDETDAIRQIKGIVDADVSVEIARTGLEVELRRDVF